MGKITFEYENNGIRVIRTIILPLDELKVDTIENCINFESSDVKFEEPNEFEADITKRDYESEIRMEE